MFSWTYCSGTDVLLARFVDAAVIEHNSKRVNVNDCSEEVTNIIREVAVFFLF